MTDNPFIKPITDVRLVYPSRSKQIVVLERIEPGVTPDYCVHGKATCYGCDNWVWLGDKTHDVVASGQAAPLCIECATEKLPKGATPSERIEDRRRTEGPH